MVSVWGVEMMALRKMQLAQGREGNTEGRQERQIRDLMGEGTGISGL